MKRLFALLFVILTLFTLSSCAGHETVTQNPGNYVYSVGQDILVYDIESGDVFACLKILDYTVCNTRAVMVYDTGTVDKYEYLLRVDYEFEQYKNRKSLDYDNFEVISGGKIVTDYMDFEIKEDVYDEYKNSDCVFVLTDSLDVILEFRYDSNQSRHTAKIDLSKTFDPNEAAETVADIYKFKENQEEIKKLKNTALVFGLTTIVFLATSVVFLFLFIIEKKKNNNSNN